MEFRVLGPLELRDERGDVELRGGRLQALLAMLLLHRDEPVRPDALVRALWGDQAPANARRAFHVHVSRLRRALGDEGLIETTPAGYRLCVQPGDVDADRFDALVDRGQQALEAGDPARAASVLREALSSWRGPPLAGIVVPQAERAEILRLEERRLAALETCMDAELALEDR